MKKSGMLFSLLAFGLSACRPSGSRTEHTQDQPMRDGSAALWVTLSPEAFMSLGGGANAYLPMGDAAVLRLQFWADRMFDTWASARPVELADVPRPQIIVERRSGANAFSVTRMRCFDVPFDARPLHPLRDENVPLARFYPNLGSEVVFLPNGASSERFCERAGNDVKTVTNYFGALNRQFRLDPTNRCWFSVENGVLVGSPRCPWREEAEYRGADGIAVPVTSNVISVQAGTFLKLDEGEAVAMLAHEMGHYFKADSSRPRRASGYFYELGDRNLPMKPQPVPDPHLRVLGRVLTELTNVQLYSSLPGQRFHPNVLFDVMTRDVYRESLWFADYLRQHCKGRQCEQRCNDFLESWESPDTQVAIHRNGYPSAEGSTLEAVDLEAYHALETRLAACSAQVSASDIFAGGFDARGFVKRALAPDVFRVTGAQLHGGVKSLLEVLQEASFAYNLADSWVKEGREKVRRYRLGWYTHEQEADDFALEQLQRLGFSPQAHVSLLWKLADANNLGIPVPGDLSRDECRAAFERGWRTADGKEEYIPLGPWGDPHHGSCYRIYNAVREIEGHRYARWPLPVRATPPGGSWEEMAAHVRTVMAARP